MLVAACGDSSKPAASRPTDGPQRTIELAERTTAAQVDDTRVDALEERTAAVPRLTAALARRLPDAASDSRSVATTGSSIVCRRRALEAGDADLQKQIGSRLGGNGIKGCLGYI